MYYRNDNLLLATSSSSYVHLQAVVDGPQYELIRGFLAHNLGEQVDQPPPAADGGGGLGFSAPAAVDPDQLWTTMFMDIELQKVDSGKRIRRK